MRGSKIQVPLLRIWRVNQDLLILLLSLLLQIALGLWFGHAYDMRLAMATGYLVSNAENPYISQDLTGVFKNNSFQSLTSIGYLPPWPLLLGLIYRSVNSFTSDLLVYNLAIKLPIIAANIYLAYLVRAMLRDLAMEIWAAKRAWIFMLLCPFILYFGPAWGQFDVIVVVLTLLSLVHLEHGRLSGSAVLLALGIAFKPIALPVFPIAMLFLAKKSPRQAITYSLWFAASLIGFCVLPFVLLSWDPAPIVAGWNAHFTVGGALSFMTFFELLKDTYQLPGTWWLLGLAWLPALGIALLSIRHGVFGFRDLLRKSLGMILVFYLTRTWLSEPNVLLVLALALILASLGELPPRLFHTLWILPLLFTVFNASPPQLLWLNFPQVNQAWQSWMEEFRSFRLLARIVLVLPWQIVGWWTVIECFKARPAWRDITHHRFLTGQV